MPTPIDWDEDSDYSLEDVQREVDRQRIGFGMNPQRDEEAERKASNKWRTEEGRDYNKSIYVGVDLGKKADHSAVILLEPFMPQINTFENVILGHKQYIYHITRIKRYDLETPYPHIARTLKKIYNQLHQSDKWDFVYFAIDEGGVGTGVTDQVVELIPNADIYRVTLSGGNKVVWHDARTASLPKPQMVSTLIALLEAGRIWWGDEKQVELLKQELLNYEMKVRQTGHDEYGAMKGGEHDDLTSAIGLAVWLAEDSGGGAVPLFW